MLTDRQIKAEISACQSEKVLTDGAGGRGTGSLILKIRRSPTKGSVSAAWFANWRIDGQLKKMALGRYPDLSLKAAREQFNNAVSPIIQAKKNPKNILAPRDMPTVEALFKARVEALRRDDMRNADEIERVLLTAKKVQTVADALGRDTMACNVEPADVSAYLSRMYDRGARGAAHHHRAYIAATFSWAMKATHDYTTKDRRDWGIKANPCDAIPVDAGAIIARDRALTVSELAKVWKAMVDCDGVTLSVSGAVRLMITCGQRVRETLRATAADFDLDSGVWTLPAKTTKGGKPHAIPLPPQAIETVRELIEAHGSGTLFPRWKVADRDKPILDTTITRAITRMIKEKEMEHFQVKDLRRTWKSRTADAGIDRFMRDLIQQHAQGDLASRHYDRADYMPQMREAMKKWGDWLAATLVAEEEKSAARAEEVKKRSRRTAFLRGTGREARPRRVAG